MIHYSLFPNEKCVICGVKVLNNALHCKKCYKKWLELSEKNAVLIAKRDFKSQKPVNP